MKVLVACEFSGIVRDEFIKRGHEAISCDLIESERPGPHIRGDVRDHLDEDWDMVLAFPPCTHLAISGARWFKDKQAEQKEAVKFFLTFVELSKKIKYVAIENPKGIMSTVYRKPDQIIQPWQFGHGEVKGYCLWLYNLPKLTPTEIVEGRDPKVWLEGPHKDRWKCRSRTPEGIARAMADQWGSGLFKVDN